MLGCIEYFDHAQYKLRRDDAGGKHNVCGMEKLNEKVRFQNPLLKICMKICQINYYSTILILFTLLIFLIIADNSL